MWLSWWFHLLIIVGIKLIHLAVTNTFVWNCKLVGSCFMLLNGHKKLPILWQIICVIQTAYEATVVLLCLSHYPLHIHPPVVHSDWIQNNAEDLWGLDYNCHMSALTFLCQWCVDLTVFVTSPTSYDLFWLTTQLDSTLDLPPMDPCASYVYHACVQSRLSHSRPHPQSWSLQLQPRPSTVHCTRTWKWIALIKLHIPRNTL